MREKLLLFILFMLSAFGGYRASHQGTFDFASTNPRESFESLKLPPLPTTPDKLGNPKTLEDLEHFLAPYHERQYLNWHPTYPVVSPSFDSFNRAYFRSHAREQVIPLTNGFHTWTGNRWEPRFLNTNTITPLFSESAQSVVTKSRQNILWDPKMAVFDKKDRMYTVLRLKTGPTADALSYVLFSSQDYGITWAATPLAGTLSTPCVFKNTKTGKCQVPELYDLERPYSGKPLSSPPAMLYYMGTGKLPSYEKSPPWMGTVGLLYLQPIIETTEGRLQTQEPVLISSTAQEIGYRSGSATKVVRSGNKYFITWLEANTKFAPALNQSGQAITPPPGADNNPYSGIWIAEYDTVTQKLIKKEILKSWPVNDTHNQPGIVRASDGSLHVISGAHGSHFTYTYSKKSDSISEWSQARPLSTQETGYKSAFNSPIWSGGGQTYISMMIDSKDVIHTAYRQWIHDNQIFDFEYFGALVYQNGKYDAALRSMTWNSPRTLIYPNAREYTHWYQVMSLDRNDVLYLEYSNLRPFPPYALKNTKGVMEYISPYLNNALLSSKDGGRRWFFPTDEDFN